MRLRTSALVRTLAVSSLVAAAALTLSATPPPAAAADRPAASVPAHAKTVTVLAAMDVHRVASTRPVLVDAALLKASLPKPKPVVKPAPAVKPRPAARTAQVATVQRTVRQVAPPPGPAVSPGSARAIAQGMLAGFGWGQDQFACLDALWNRESGWNVHAASGSGAYGIPQALPGSKMASAGPDWANNASTQIRWGLGYIKGRYGSPCAAWSHSQSTGWY